MNYTEAVEYVLSVPKFTKKNKLENTVELMERLGRPERKMKIIHVAGTNGKGSVCAYLSSILERAGKKVGLFTSPHLVRINERFQINHQPISDALFLESYEKVWSAIEGMVRDGFYHPTYFEILFALCMRAFEKENVEYVVLETGLGGRLDATNIVERPVAEVLTSISLDHTEILGDTIEKIAWEKAGILKKGVPVIYDANEKKAETVILHKAQEMGAAAYPVDRAMCELLERTDRSITYRLANPQCAGWTITVPYAASYQVMNSAVAATAARVISERLGLSISEKTVAEGIAGTKWEGRMETVLPGVIVDGGHNAAGIQEFVKTVRELEKGRKITMLFSAVVEKNYEKMIQEICEGANLSSVVVTEIHNDRIVPAEELKQIFERYTKAKVTAVPDIAEAFEEAMREKEDGMLFCAGSLYLVGELKGILETGKYSKTQEGKV